jgi:hypothetical protein
MNESKYQKEISDLLVATKAKGIVVVVIGGKHGDCYEVRATDDRIFQAMPGVLNELSQKIKKSIQPEESNETR